MIEEIIYNQLNNVFSEKVSESLSFFIYDTVKIMILLFLMIMAIGYLRTYVSQKKIKELLSKKGGLSNLFASLFGALTPFCSCSSIPFFMGFIRAGVPLGVTFSFLITSPLVNEYVAVIMLATFGWKIALLYVISGILIGVVAGSVIGKMKLNGEIEKEFHAQNNLKEVEYTSQKQRLRFGYTESIDILKKMWLWIIVGVGLGALIHGFVPEQFVQDILARGGFLAVPIATIIGVPLYANCAAIIPVALVLFEKGFPLGTALSFMMATAALSLPEAIILRKVIKLKLIAIFFGIVTLSIIFIGYMFNFIMPYLT